MVILLLIIKVFALLFGVVLISFRWIIRYRAEKIIIKKRIKQEMHRTMRGQSFYRYLVIYEVDGITYYMKSIEFGVTFFKFSPEVVCNVTGRKSKRGFISCDGVYSLEIIGVLFILGSILSGVNEYL